MGPTVSTTFSPAAGPADIERTVANDLVKRALPVAPVLLVIGFLVWGPEGAFSSAYGIVLVCLNFLLAAAVLSWAARISLGLLMTAALFGYLLRLALIFAAVLLVKDAGWVELWPLGLTIIVTHLGLLLWETRYVSANLAFPGLKPRRKD